MRSVDKGLVPVDVDGHPLAFGEYGDASPHLKRRIGRYCSYCERPIRASLAVEHKLPKRWHPWLDRDWHNLILACSNCNSCKGDDQVTGVLPMWPDEEDTFDCMEYRRSGAIAPRPGLPAGEVDRVQRLLALVGLDRSPAQCGSTDHRFFDRLEIWSLAMQAARDLELADSPELRRATLDTARQSGGYSIWRHVFAGDAGMTANLIAAFPGTRGQPAR